MLSFDQKRKSFKLSFLILFTLKQNNTYQLISIILLIAMISFAGLYFIQKSSIPKINEESCSSFIRECPAPEEKALVFGWLNSWGENMYDSSEYILYLDVFNFGEVEAKNVEVSCNLTVGDEDGYEVSNISVSNISKRIGNIASNSYKFIELNLEKNTKKEGNYPLAVCAVTYCDNCELLNNKFRVD